MRLYTASEIDLIRTSMRFPYLSRKDLLLEAVQLGGQSPQAYRFACTITGQPLGPSCTGNGVLGNASTGRDPDLYPFE